MVIYCTILNQILCGTYKKVSHRTEQEMSTMNLICSSETNHCCFWKFLSGIVAEGSNLPNHKEVQWLNSDKLWFLSSDLRWNFFECKEMPSTTITKHWMALKISFCFRLDNAF